MSDNKKNSNASQLKKGTPEEKHKAAQELGKKGGQNKNKQDNHSSKKPSWQ